MWPPAATAWCASGCCLRLSAGHTTLRPVHPGGGEGREAKNVHGSLVQVRTRATSEASIFEIVPSQHNKTTSWIQKSVHSRFISRDTKRVQKCFTTPLRFAFSTSPAFSAPSGCAPTPPALAPHGPAAAPVRPPPLLTPMPLAHRCCAACSKSSPLMKPDCTSSAQKPILALRKSAWPARACGRAYTVRPCSRLWRGQRARYRPPP